MAFIGSDVETNGSVTITTASWTPPALTFPAGIADGDLCVVTFASYRVGAPTSTVTFDAGAWQQRGTEQNSAVTSDDAHFHSYEKLYEAAVDGPSVVATAARSSGSGAAGYYGGIMALLVWRGPQLVGAAGSGIDDGGSASTAHVDIDILSTANSIGANSTTLITQYVLLEDAAGDITPTFPAEHTNVLAVELDLAPLGMSSDIHYWCNTEVHASAANYPTRSADFDIGVAGFFVGVGAYVIPSTRDTVPATSGSWSWHA